MLHPGMVELFYDWLNEGEESWEKLGLKEDAPEAAKEAYSEYLELAKEDRENDTTNC